MNKQEAEKVLRILLTADGGCEYCSADLIERFNKLFPEFEALSDEYFRKAFTKSSHGSKKRHKEEQDESL